MNVLRIGTCTVDLDRRRLLRPGLPEEALGDLDSRLLAYLAAHAGEEVDYETLLVEVWEYHPAHPIGVVQTAVSRLRKLIEDVPSRPRHLFTVRGRGYRLEGVRSEGAAPAIATEAAPVELDAFVGRAEEQQRLATMWGKARLVTLAGPPGAGKTRLAKRYLASARADPALLAELAGVDDALAALTVVAAAVGVHVDGTGEDAVAARLGNALDRLAAPLLLLDNAEHLVDAVAAWVSRWLTEAPGARLLVTSREPLRVRGEHVVRLGPLSVAERVELLRERVTQRGVRPPADEVLRALVERLEPFPLSVELAAGQVAAIGAEAVMARISEAPLALASDLRDIVPRHASLEAAIGSSWSLLERGEQEVLAVCGVFRGGFTTDAVAEVAGAAADQRVAALERKSLVHPVTGKAGRYDMFPSVRAFAEARLAGQRADVVGRHAGWALDHAPSDRAARHAWVSSELANLMAAHRRTLGSAPDRSARLALLLDEVLRRRGPLATRMYLCRSALEALTEPEPALRAELAFRLGDAERRIGEVEAAGASLALALEHAEAAGAAGQAVDIRVAIAHLQVDRGRLDLATAEIAHIAEPVRDPKRRGEILAVQGRIQTQRGEYGRALVTHGQALESYEAAGELDMQANALMSLGGVYMQLGELQRSEHDYRRALALQERVGNRREAGIALCYLGHLAVVGGDLAAALELNADALRIFEESGDTPYESTTRLALADVEVRMGRLDEAEADLHRAVALARRAGRPRRVGTALGNLGYVALLQAAPDRAATHLEQAVEILERTENHPARLYFLGLLAGAHAWLGREARAEELLALVDALALQLAKDADDRFSAEAVRAVYRGLARALSANRREAHGQSGEALRAEARRDLHLAGPLLEGTYVGSFSDVVRLLRDAIGD